MRPAASRQLNIFAATPGRTSPWAWDWNPLKPQPPSKSLAFEPVPNRQNWFGTMNPSGAAVWRCRRRAALRLSDGYGFFDNRSIK
jgi:hypothetical protein